ASSTTWRSRSSSGRRTPSRRRRAGTPSGASSSRRASPRTPPRGCARARRRRAGTRPPARRGGRRAPAPPAPRARTARRCWRAGAHGAPRARRGRARDRRGRRARASGAAAAIPRGPRARRAGPGRARGRPCSRTPGPRRATRAPARDRRDGPAPTAELRVPRHRAYPARIIGGSGAAAPDRSFGGRGNTGRRRGVHQDKGVMTESQRHLAAADEADLVALADGSLSHGRRAEVEARVGREPDLAAALERQRCALSLLAQLTTPAPLELRVRVAELRERRRSPRLRRWLPAAVVTAAALLVAVSGGAPAA